jgi:hypothetical protein
MRVISLSLIVLLSFSATSAASGKGGQAAVSLSNASAALSQTSDPAWTLDKSGALSGSTRSNSFVQGIAAVMGADAARAGQACELPGAAFAPR